MWVIGCNGRRIWADEEPTRAEEIETCGADCECGTCSADATRAGRPSGNGPAIYDRSGACIGNCEATIPDPGMAPYWRARHYDFPLVRVGRITLGPGAEVWRSRLQALTPDERRTVWASKW
jgi:hypothetical protein